MFTVKQVSDHIGVSEATIRLHWGKEFAAYLSDTANPPKGETRHYTEEDIAVLLTVSLLRNQQKSYEEIHPALAEGVRLERPEGEEKPPPGAPETPENQPETALITQSFAEALRTYETRLNKLEDKLEETRERLLESEKRAAAAETRAEMLQQQLDQVQELPAPASSAPPQETPVSGWKRFTAWLTGKPTPEE